MGMSNFYRKKEAVVIRIIKIQSLGVAYEER